MLKPLRPTWVSGGSSASVFATRCLTLTCSLIVFLSGLGVGASAQTKPADSQLGDPSAAVQNVPSDAQTSAGPVSDPGQEFVHIVPFGKVKSALKTGFAPAGAHLTYWGGQVISNIHPVAVFWGPNVNPAITGVPGVAQFFTDITTSRYYDLLTEYNTVGILGAATPQVSTNQIIGHGTFDGQFHNYPIHLPWSSRVYCHGWSSSRGIGQSDYCGAFAPAGNRQSGKC